MNNAKCNQTTLIKKGRVFDFYMENITLPHGVTMDMDVIRHPGAAAIVPVMDDGRVLLLKQYRHAVGGFIWEIPAGTLDADEDEMTCAKRELIEETGYTAREMKKMAVITPLPAYSDERIHIFLATDLTRATQDLDDDELLSVHPIAMRTALAMIADGQIEDAKTIASLHLASNCLD
ncbi:hydrolase, NUDIX family [Desulfosarcina variabilis str. Montpellier]|uniref:NUDIX domain-containing protein n=1 Tax=Desulfosarcina variabilis TaxID=2300 RepID=UPI003AFA386C